MVINQCLVFACFGVEFLAWALYLCGVGYVVCLGCFGGGVVVKDKLRSFSVNQLLNVVDAARGAKGCAKATKFVEELDAHDMDVNHVEPLRSPSSDELVKLARAGLRVVRLLR